jgi:hypothetical protein
MAVISSPPLGGAGALTPVPVEIFAFNWMPDDIRIDLVGCVKSGVDYQCPKNLARNLTALSYCQRQAIDRCVRDSLNKLPSQDKFCGRRHENTAYVDNPCSEYLTDSGRVVTNATPVSRSIVANPYPH